MAINPIERNVQGTENRGLASETSVSTGIQSTALQTPASSTRALNGSNQTSPWANREAIDSKGKDWRLLQSGYLHAPLTAGSVPQEGWNTPVDEWSADFYAREQGRVTKPRELVSSSNQSGTVNIIPV